MSGVQYIDKEIRNFCYPNSYDNDRIDLLERCNEFELYDLEYLIAELLLNDSDQSTKQKIEERIEVLENRRRLERFAEIKTEEKNLPPNRPDSIPGIYNVYLCCNWIPSSDLCKLWNKMSKGGYSWNSIRIVWEANKADYYCIINRPRQSISGVKNEDNLAIHMFNDSCRNTTYIYADNGQSICVSCGKQVYILSNDKTEFTTDEKKRTILFSMEPNSAGIWNVDRNELMSFNDHSVYNNLEWHISKTYIELTTGVITKNNKLDRVVSTILSSRYVDPGQKKRVDFAKFLDTKQGITLHTYGANLECKNYGGKLPYHMKDKGLLPYKYTFNVENNSIPNYFTEKLIDGILSECLVFYSGCPNVGEYIPEGAFVYLDLNDFEGSYNTIKDCIDRDEWSKRLPCIREAKMKILNELQFFPRLERIINGINKCRISIKS